MKKKVYVFLCNGFSDWEIAYITPEIKKSNEFDLIYFSQYGDSVLSMGGLTVLPDVSLEDIDPNGVDMLILPGGTSWESGENDFIEPLVSELFRSGIAIAAICAATIYLGENGFMNNLKHTSNDLAYLKAVAPHYLGENNYLNLLAVSDNNLITANGIAPIEFAREILSKLKLYDDSKIENWFQLFKNGIWSGLL